MAIVKDESERNIIDKLKVGEIYKHYKGNLYKVIALARNSEDLSLMVIYQDQGTSESFGENSVWARPADMFLQEDEFEGKVQPRFKLVEAANR